MSTDEYEKAINMARGLFTIPVIGDSLVHKIKELIQVIALNKEAYLPYIDYGIGSEFLKELEFEDIDDDSGVIQFKLFGLTDSLWIPVTSVRGVNPFCIVPEPVAEYIVKESLQNPGLMFMKKKVTFPELPGMSFDISFERDTSKPLISGVIKERNGKKFEEKPVNSDRILYEGSEKLKNIREMNKLMLSNDEYYWYTISEFRRYWQLYGNKESKAAAG
jgi:hypothetical protein